MSQPAAADPDPLDLTEPTDEEIAAAQRDENRADTAATRALQDQARRGPGRPPGSRNRSKGERAARDAGKKTSVAATRPKLSGAAADSARAAAKARRDERARTVNDWTKAAMDKRGDIVKGIGVATGLPPQYLVGHQGDANGNVIIDHETQKPIEVLTAYGEALAPKEWQIKAACETGVRIVETETGERLLEAFDKYAPYLYGLAALGGLVMYTVTTLQTVQAIKPMIAAEMQAQAEAAAAAQAGQQQPPAPENPGGPASAGGPTG